ncbi:hypothetical protein OG223_33650 [Streptomyces sp. NBC_01478]|nr:hypothetical protein [Streptomyces sp. NBC_01478]
MPPRRPRIAIEDVGGTGGDRDGGGHRGEGEGEGDGGVGGGTRPMGP